MAEGSYRYYSEPAGPLIRQLGGVRALARELGVSPEAVSKCNRPRERGGTAGAFPREWHEKIIALAGERGSGKWGDVAIVRMRLRIASNRKEPREDRVHPAKAKGDRFEREVAADLCAAGFSAHRVPLSGAVPGYHGDVRVKTPTGDWVIQCKISTDRKNANGRDAGSRGRGAVERMLAQVSFGLVEVGEVTYIAMRQPIFENYLRGVQPSALNVPHVRLVSARSIAEDISGHDALVFRRGKAPEWMAIVVRDHRP